MHSNLILETEVNKKGIKVTNRTYLHRSLRRPVEQPYHGGRPLLPRAETLCGMTQLGLDHNEDVWLHDDMLHRLLLARLLLRLRSDGLPDLRPAEKLY